VSVDTILASTRASALGAGRTAQVGGQLVEVRFEATSRQAVGGTHVDVEWSDGLTVWGFVTQMVERHPALGPQLLDGEGKLARHIRVMVNGRDAPYLSTGRDTLPCEADKIDVFPPVGGG
jgi:sulfur-carrier protein